MMPDLLALATAGLKPDQLADTQHTQYPRVDYIELQRLIGLRVLDYSVYNSTPFGSYLRYAETLLRSDIYLAFLGLLAKNRYRVVFTMSERVGIPVCRFTAAGSQSKTLGLHVHMLVSPPELVDHHVEFVIFDGCDRGQVRQSETASCKPGRVGGASSCHSS